MKNLTLLLLSALCLGRSFAGTPTALESSSAPGNPLSFADGKLILDFQERMRFEARENNFDFNDGIDSLTDDSWLLQRARLGLKFMPSDIIAFYVQGQSSLEFESDRADTPGVLGAEGDDAIDLRQAYVQIGPKHFNVTAGRQVLAYGDERLIGSFDWNTIGRTFDAVKLHYAADTWNLDAFASSAVAPDKDGFNHSDLFDGNETGRNQIFSGLYFSSTFLPAQTTDFYLLHLHEEFANGDSNFFTAGTRIKADIKKTGGWDYETEMAVQAGEVRDRDLTAFAGHWGAGYVWTQNAWKPRLFVEYNYATGDDDAADDETETFQNLFPTNHKFYGYMDVFSWQNMHNPAVSFSVNPAKSLKLQTDFHAFWLADTGDAWYRANGMTAVRPVDRGADRFVGTELDFTATWKATKNMSLLAGYSHFFAGYYLKSTGPADDADFAYAQLTIDF